MQIGEYYKYGYYRVKDQITRSKLEAIELCRQHEWTWPSWHFHDEVFSSMNWLQEPNESLESLYQTRARQLREKYDHIVIMYSGGTDSHNLLMSFLSQGILPNEVVFFYHSLAGDSNVINLEWKLQTWPRLQKILEQWPGIKLTRIDISDFTLDFMAKRIDDIPYLYTNLAPNNSMRSYLNILHRPWLDLKTQGRSLRLIYGIDKPRLRFDGRHYIFNFYDFLKSGSCDASEFDDIEWFYWTADFPKICVKQAHVVKKYWQTNKHRWKELGVNENKKLGWVFEKENIEVTYLLYPWCQGNFLKWRPKKYLFGDRDLELIESNTEITKKYKDMCSSFIGRIDPMFFNNKIASQGLVGSISKDYYLD